MKVVTHIKRLLLSLLSTTHMHNGTPCPTTNRSFGYMHSPLCRSRSGGSLRQFLKFCVTLPRNVGNLMFQFFRSLA